MNDLIKLFRNFLTSSSHFHIRKRPVSSIRELVDLTDRFLADEVAYPLEWDDFIAWKHANPTVEEFRRRVSDLEGMLCSANKADRQRYMIHVIEERNRIAAFLGIPERALASYLQ